MQTSLVGNNYQRASGDAAITTASETSDMFTKLLVAQIRNQDPLAPTDPSDFVNQLAQLSQTESLQNLATLTSNNASVLQSLQVLALGAQVGSQVTVDTGSVKLADTPLKGVITLDSSAARTTLVLTGADGIKHKVELGTHAAGEVPFTIDPAALGLPPGQYALAVDTDTKGTSSIAIAGKLNSVKLSSSGSVVLDVAGLGEVSPSAITGFHGPASAASLTASN